MSFVLNRSDTLKPVKKEISTSNTINQDSLKASIGSTGSSEFLILTSLSINNTQINASTTELNYLQVSPGIAQALKALVLDASRNITNIGQIVCTNSITVNGTVITNNSDIPTGSSDDSNNPLLTNIQLGIATPNKALVLNYKKEIKNLNNVNVNSIQIRDCKLNLNNSKFHLETIKNKLYYQPNVFNNTANNNYIVTSSYSFFNNGLWSSSCWSDELGLFVVVGAYTASNVNNIMYSYDGMNWNSCIDPNPFVGYNKVCWAPEIKLFIAVGNNVIINSKDGINWTSSRISDLINFQSVCWSPELNLFVAVGDSNAINRILISNDGFIWNMPSNGVYANTWVDVCWSPQLNMFVAVANNTGSTISSRIMVSNDGNNWSIINNNVANNRIFINIVWAPELNMFVASNSSTTSRIFRSYDGYNWDYCYGNTDGTTTSQWGSKTIMPIIWISELHVFVAMFAENTTYINISYNGIDWYAYSHVTTVSNTSLCWSSKNGLLTTSSLTNKINLITEFSKQIGISDNILYFNQSTNNVGVNTKLPQSQFDINATDGKCLKLINSTVNSEFNIDNTGQLNIIPSLNNTLLNTSFISNGGAGIKLNNVLLMPTILDYDYINNLQLGISTPNKALLTDASNNISNINILYCNSLTINEQSVNNSNTNPYLENLVLGTAMPSKPLSCDLNSNINNLNQLSINKLALEYDNIYLNSNIDIENAILINKFKYKNNENLINLVSTNWCTSSISSSTFNDICYSPALQLYIVCTNAGLYSSKNLTSWNLIYIGEYTNFTFKNICWSNELNKFAVVSWNSNSDNILTSSDGVNWINGINISISSNTKVEIIWVNKLKSFIYVKPSQLLMSNDGINWNNSPIMSSNNWSSVCWSDKLNLLLVCSATNKRIASSPDGINWTYTIPASISAMPYNSICWSDKLNMAIATANNAAYAYSFNGINWFVGIAPNSLSNIIWCNDLNVFISGTTASSSTISYSFTGFTWFTIPMNISATWRRLFWAKHKNILFAINTNTSSQISYYILPHNKKSGSHLISHKSQVFFNKSTGNLGLGTVTPNYQLELSSDSAAKATSSTWTISSDQRLKENIENADLNICYNVIKNLSLKRYKWKDSIFENFKIKDRTKLGWIADEVETVFPKAVEIKNAFGISDCKILNIEQIITSIYGCTQKLISDFESDNNKINNLETKLNFINEFIAKLE